MAKLSVVVWLAAGLLLSACSTTPKQETHDVQLEQAEAEFDFTDERDPFEDFNRTMWDFNRHKLDPYVILPMANTYEKVPSVLRQGFYNFTDNLEEPINLVYNLLQLKISHAAANLGRFVMNTGFGFLGFFDVATSVGLVPKKETIGETLYVYGVPEGPYFMLPAAGPSVILDTGGELADTFIWPSFMGWQFTVAKYLLRGLDKRIEMKQLEPVLANSLDEYSFVREAYFSHWYDKVYDGNVPAGNMWDEPWDNDWDSQWDEEWNQADAYNPSATVTFSYQSWQQIKQEKVALH